ncbi:hypothetical protein KAW18_04255 [candidate division WOR-3 bacterium]|nr:hypothetical protein [candidate division WOR-3 bacterium]
MIESLHAVLPDWLNTMGPYPDIAFLSKVSLFRNIRDHKFIIQATDEEKAEILGLLTDGINSILKEEIVLTFDKIRGYERKFLFERHFITEYEMNNGDFLGLAVNKHQNNILILNADEHLRISSISSGFNLREPFSECDELDGLFSNEFDFSYDKEFGFLTSSPQRVGTGLEVEVILHLPAVVITGSAGELITRLEGYNFSMDGAFRTDGGVEGSLLQINSQFTLGVTEEEIIQKAEEQIMWVINMEIDAREYLMDKAPYETEDKIWRSYGILKNARLLNMEDFLNLASAVRLGVGLGLIKDIVLLDLNRWTILSQPGHLMVASGGEIEPREENIFRSNLIRKDGGVQ